VEKIVKLWVREKCLFIDFITDLFIAVLVTIILDGTVKTFAEIVILMMFNIFAIPLWFVFSGYPWWVYYIVVLTWLSSIGFYLTLERAIKEERANEDASS